MLKPPHAFTRPLSRVAKFRRATPPNAPQWPSFTGVSTYVGTSSDGRVDVFVDSSLGDAAMQNAIDLVSDASRITAGNDSIFGGRGGSVQVIVFAIGGQTDGTGGADHMGCDFETGGAIEVCASFGNSQRVSALFEAELSECSMGNNLCGESTGEGLSRWCASSLTHNALADFSTAPTWYADGAPNFVDETDPTDQNPDSTGCAMAFLSWLQSMGYTLAQIAQEMVGLGDGGTLACAYSGLTGDAEANAWTNFEAAVKALPGGVPNDDPFAGIATPAPGPAPAPNPGPSPAPTAVTLEQATLWAAYGAAQSLRANWPAGDPAAARPAAAREASNPQTGPQPYRG